MPMGNIGSERGRASCVRSWVGSSVPSAVPCACGPVATLQSALIESRCEFVLPSVRELNQYQSAGPVCSRSPHDSWITVCGVFFTPAPCQIPRADRRCSSPICVLRRPLAATASRRPRLACQRFIYAVCSGVSPQESRHAVTLYGTNDYEEPMWNCPWM